MVHGFAASFTAGKRGEHVLDRFFARRGIRVTPVSRTEERRGIDRVFGLQDGRNVNIEYKTDEAAARTGNVFIETISVDSVPKHGWGFSCEADWIVIYIPGLSSAYVVRPQVIREHLYSWTSMFKVRAATNDGYHTYGVLVPVWNIELVAAAKYEIEPDDE